MKSLKLVVVIFIGVFFMHTELTLAQLIDTKNKVEYVEDLESQDLNFIQAPIEFKVEPAKKVRFNIKRRPVVKVQPKTEVFVANDTKRIVKVSETEEKKVSKLKDEKQEEISISMERLEKIASLQRSSRMNKGKKISKKCFKESTEPCGMNKK